MQHALRGRLSRTPTWLLPAVLAALAPSCMLQVDEMDEPSTGSSATADADALTSEESVSVTSSELRSPVRLAAGAYSACATGPGGTVSCWGRDGFAAALRTPVPTGLNDAVSLDVNQSGSVITATGLGTVMYHLLGSSVLGTVPGISGVSKIATSGVEYPHSCLLLTTGRVRCTGPTNAYGQLGNGTMTAPPSGTWVDVLDLTDAVDISVGGYHTCAKRATGQLVCWGYAPAIGDGTQASKSRPTNVPGMTSVGSFSAGWYHTCATQGSARNVSCWGVNWTGAIGDGTNNFRVSPTAVGITAQSVSAGAGHTCAITSTSGWGVKCWGSNGFGQMGTSSVLAQKTPFAVPAPSPSLTPTLIDAGGNFTCAAKTGSSGNVVCWGANEVGQLGNGTTEAFTTVRPTYVIGDSLKLNGETCTGDTQCQSKSCIDGVCCNSRCGNGLSTDCQACSTAAGAAVNGTCGPMAAFRQCGVSPNGVCPLYCNGAALTCPPANNPPLCGG